MTEPTEPNPYQPPGESAPQPTEPYAPPPTEPYAAPPQPPPTQPYAPPPAAPYTPPPAGYPQPGGYGSPPAAAQPYGAPYPPQAVPTTSNDAVIALVLAICAWLICPVILAVVALVFAGRAKRAIDSSGGWVTGEGMVTAAKVVSWINIGLYLVGLVIFVIILIGVAVSSSTSSTIGA